MELRAACGTVAVFTLTVSAALDIAVPRLLIPYGVACVVVYGPTAVALAYRSRSAVPAVKKAHRSSAEIELCESCGQRPSVRLLVVNDEPFALCESCIPPVNQEIPVSRITHS